MKDAWGPTKTILGITMVIGRVDNAASGADGGCGGEGARKAAKGMEQPKGRSGASVAEVGFSSKKVPDCCPIWLCQLGVR